MKRLSQSGLTHLILPVLIFVIIFGIGGYVLLKHTKAATNADYFKSGISGKCLDDYQDGSANGTVVDSYACNSTAAQSWTVNSNGTIEDASGKCLDNWQQKDANGNPIKTYTCSATDPAEQWQLTSNTLKNPRTNKCIDDPAFSTTNGKPLELYTCNGGSNQKWTKTAVSSGTSTGTGTGSGTGSGGTPPPSTGSAATDGCTVNGVIAPCMNGTVSGAGTSGYGAPAFDDEFNGTSLNTSNWIPGRREGGGECTSACGGYNPGAEAELFDSSQVTESGGSLALTATDKSLNGGTNPYTSGTVEMQNNKNFVYGYFEARIKVPDPTTAWTGFWLSSAATWPPELDIFEFSQCGDQPTFNNHGNTPNSNVNAAGWPCGQAYGTSSTDFTQWHTYGLLWTANTLKVYFDGMLQTLTTYSSKDAIPTTAMYPIFSYTIHSGTTVPNNSQMDVDYLRVWCPGGGTSCMK